MIKKIISAILSFATVFLQFLKIYESEQYIYSLDSGLTVTENQYNFFTAISSNAFDAFEKTLMLLFFIIPLLVGIYFLQSIWTKYYSTNIDLILIIASLCVGLMVFAFTTTIGHIISCVSFVTLAVYIAFQIKEA